MPPAPPAPTSLAQRLLDAQVGWAIAQLTGPALPTLIENDLDDLLAIGRKIDVAELVDAAEVKRIARLIVGTVPPSTAATTLVEKSAQVLYDGPTEPFTLADLIDRDNVEKLVQEALALTSFAEKFLDRLAESPLVAGLAARFMGRIVNDVVQANRAVAEKIPGVGSLVSFGANAAGRMISVADKQVEQLLGDTAGKGATFAMRRLNKVVIETLKDPTARAAALQVFDLYADEPVPHLSVLGSREDAERVAGLLHDVVIAGAPTEPVLALVDALIDGFFEVYGAHPVTSLIEDLDLTRDELVARATPLVTRALKSAQDSGELEPLIRSRLAPFFESAEVAEILGSA